MFVSCVLLQVHWCFEGFRWLLIYSRARSENKKIDLDTNVKHFTDNQVTSYS